MNVFKKLRAHLRLRTAIEMADKKYLESGQRQYVVPMLGKGHKLVVVDRKNFRILKRKHYLPAEMTIPDLEQGCFYATPYADGSHAFSAPDLSVKQQMYYAWCRL